MDCFLVANKVMEWAGALHGVGHAGNFCLELGKEGEGGAEFSATHSADMEAGDPRGPEYLKNPWDHAAFTLHDQDKKGTALSLSTQGCFLSMAFLADFLQEIVRCLQAAVVSPFIEETQGRHYFSLESRAVMCSHVHQPQAPWGVEKSLGNLCVTRKHLPPALPCTVHPAPCRGEESPGRRNYFVSDWKIPCNSCPSSFPAILEETGSAFEWELQGYEALLSKSQLWKTL